MIDESASLGDSSQGKPGNDPTGRRVTAAQVAIDGIANLASAGTSVDVLLTGFSDDLHVYGGWQKLDLDSRTGIEQQLEAFRARNQGQDTDFYNAIAGVQQQLATQAATLGAHVAAVRAGAAVHRRALRDRHACRQAVRPESQRSARDVKAAAGIAALCAADGPMQRLRNDGARTITLALSDPSVAVTNPPDPGFLQRLATGDCSTPGDHYGAAFDASNTADLVGQFDSIATRLRGGTQLAGDCAAPQPLQIVPALRSFHIFADAGAAPGNVVITPPVGPAVQINPADGKTTPITGITCAPPRPGTGSSSSRHRRRRAPTAIHPVGRAHGPSRSRSPRATPGAASPSSRRRSRACARSTCSEASPRRSSSTSSAKTARSHPPTRFPPTPGSARPCRTDRRRPRRRRWRSRRSASASKRSTRSPTRSPGQTAIVTATLHFGLAGTEVASSPSATQLQVRIRAGFPSISPSTLRLASVTGLGSSQGNDHRRRRRRLSGRRVYRPRRLPHVATRPAARSSSPRAKEPA